ncbi:MAG: hypothetical protein QNJ46_17925 [Leptolyngbyaceae cyanobacterium MO_188.B28]|nr:hypothetical protein [Leptolyngbyaceae cyanobacterium MO_188.B28]
MQTSSTFLLLVNFLAVSLTAGVGAISALHSEADSMAPSQITQTTEGSNILSANRGSGRVNSAQISPDDIAWRGSGRIETDLADREDSQFDQRLAWRGSGRVQPNLDARLSNQIEIKVAWRGSGRVDSIQTGVNLDV